MIRFVFILSAISSLIILNACQKADSENELELRNLHSKEVLIATRNAPTTYYIDKDGETAGFEYELAQQFANSVGKIAKFKVFDTIEEIQNAVREGSVDFAAAGLMRTPKREQEFVFGPDYQLVSQLLVCHDNVIGSRMEQNDRQVYCSYRP